MITGGLVGAIPNYASIAVPHFEEPVFVNDDGPSNRFRFVAVGNDNLVFSTPVYAVLRLGIFDQILRLGNAVYYFPFGGAAIPHSPETFFHNDLGCDDQMGLVFGSIHDRPFKCPPKCHAAVFTNCQTNAVTITNGRARVPAAVVEILCSIQRDDA